MDWASFTTSLRDCADIAQNNRNAHGQLRQTGVLVPMAAIIERTCTERSIGREGDQKMEAESIKWRLVDFRRV